MNMTHPSRSAPGMLRCWRCTSGSRRALSGRKCGTGRAATLPACSDQSSAATGGTSPSRWASGRRTAGRIENCQIGVFLAYAAPRGRAFLDRALYRPQAWAADRERRQAAGIPPAAPVATKPALARTMLARAFAAAVPAAWVAGDTVYGGDGRFRQWLEAEGRAYVLAVPHTHRVWRGDGQSLSAKRVVEHLPAAEWRRLSAGQGAQGPRWYDWAVVPLPAGPTAMAHWLLARRSVSDPTELAYYRASGPATASLAELVRVAGSRWAVEVGFEQAKGEVGLDEYEVRTWDAWHRHITLALLAHAYLEVTRTASAPEKGAALPATTR